MFKPYMLQKHSTKLPVSVAEVLITKIIMLLYRYKQMPSVKHNQEEKINTNPPLILKLVNNYLGSISYVLILVGL